VTVEQTAGTPAALAFAADLVAACGAWAAQQQATVAEQKKDAATLSGSVVTAVDLEVERRVDAALAERFGDDAFIGEEYAHREGTSGRTWHVDPVDGTLNYARRLGPWSVVLSAWVRQRCELVAVWTQGVVYTAAREHGAFKDGVRLTLPLHDVESGGLVRVPARLAPTALAAGWLARSVDSSATELCQVADGRITGTVRLGGHPRDLHGPALLVEEAGGVVTDLAGGPWSSQSTGLVAAAAGAHAALLGLVP
jgi:myo-inositol-1(or 4)-monophosphatase